MIYAYFLENESLIYQVNNQPLFKLIRECDLSEDKIYIDAMYNTDRNELHQLCGIAVAGDTIMVRSIADLADTSSEIINLLKHFGDTDVEIVSLKEDYYSYKENFNIVLDMLLIPIELSEKKRKLGIEKAKAEGRMGRKANIYVKDKVYRLKKANFPDNEIMEMCKISRSTYYRILKEKNMR